MQKNHLDTTFDFTMDTPGYWDHFWENNRGLGAGGNDPDAMSKTLQQYHKILWSRPLPNGEKMELVAGSGYTYLTWNGFRFGSDSIIASFRYHKYRHMIQLLEKELPDYKAYMENFLHKTYTIGGMIIFPKRVGGINQARGCNPLIRDRWDLTLECIRRHYANEASPLSEVLEKDRRFFDLFGSFEGYVDFFFLQDCVDSNYQSAKMWLDNDVFTEDPLPKTVDAYLKWMNCQLEFVQKRNSRIAACWRQKSPGS